MCPGSIVCLSLLDDLPNVSVQDCDAMRQSDDLPSWLNGTPIFIDEDEGVPYRGRDAIAHMQQLIAVHQKDDKLILIDESPEEEDVMEAVDTKKSDAPDDLFEVMPEVASETSSSKVSEDELQKFIQSRQRS